MSTVTFTGLLRKPKEALAHINEEQVRITHRDGDDLVILRGHNLDTLSQGVALSSQILRVSGRNRGDTVAAVCDFYVWAAVL